MPGRFQLFPRKLTHGLCALESCGKPFTARVKWAKFCCRKHARQFRYRLEMERAKSGFCVLCDKPRAKGNALHCEAHREKVREKVRLRLRGLKRQGKCITCGLPRGKRGTRWECGKCAEKSRTEKRKVRSENLSKGLCGCGKRPPLPGLKWCEKCRTRSTTHMNERNQARVAEGVCNTCGQADVERYKSCPKCRRRNKERRDRRGTVTI